MRTRLVIVILLIVGIALAVFFAWPGASDPTTDVARVRMGATSQPAPVNYVFNDNSVALNSTNTKVTFTATKSILGKRANVSGGWDGRMGSKIDGSASFGKDKTPAQLKVNIDIASLWTEHDQLTHNLLHCGFFRPEQFPTATFQSRQITMHDASCTVAGRLTINGIAREIEFDAPIAGAGQSLKMDCKFVLNRRDFDVLYKDNSAFPLLDDSNILPEVVLAVHIDTSEGPSPVTQPGRALTTAPAALVREFKQTIAFSQVQFEMVLIDGDPARGIRPFYLGRREVTWDEFLPWAACNDIPQEDQQAEARALKQRPSAPYWQLDRGFGLANRPALSMSLLSAQLYCQWLSRQTGRTYRLPTEKEWEHAFVLGGGDLKTPLTETQANAQAVWKGNSLVAELSRAVSQPVGSKAPNRLGVFDMIGNAAEWVTATADGKHVVRGGHYESPLAELGARGREEQDDNTWNANDPGDPKSPWWFYDHQGIGLRLVCEP